MMKSGIKDSINASWRRCDALGLNHEQLSPYTVKEKALKRIKAKNKGLIEVFIECSQRLNNNLDENLICLLTDNNGLLMKIEGCNIMSTKLKSLGIKEGISFVEDSCGTNAISQAIITKEKTYIEPTEHYMNCFKEFYCHCTPIIFSNKTIAYLAIITINTAMKKELKVIAELFPNEVLLNFKFKNQSEDNNIIKRLSTKQKELLSYIVMGCSEKEIADKMFISLATVKFHKKQLYNNLDVNNVKEAIAKYYDVL